MRLSVEGLTNLQIGERLFISRRTVQTHLSHPLTKHEVTWRVELATDAARLSSPERLGRGTDPSPPTFDPGDPKDKQRKRRLVVEQTPGCKESERIRGSSTQTPPFASP